MKIIQGERIPIMSWCGEPESGAIDQARNLTKLDFTFKHIALMPDTHQGYGMPIGGVMATDGVIVPNAVGVDIGCGMCAIKTNISTIENKLLKEIIVQIREEIPVGFKKHKKSQDPQLLKKSDYGVVGAHYDNALKSLGTLGGGNHFIEIQKGNDKHIWIMIHSGSRNLGQQVANYYNKLAKKLNKQYHSKIIQDLNFLPIDSLEGKNYIEEMQYCVDYALANRKLMMDRVKNIFVNKLPGIKFDEMINIAHNYARLETHFNNYVWVHRKGATSAREGEIGIIPGSQGTSSYIVQGRGNLDSFMSCSHGAGRKMSRNKAQEKLDLKKQIKLLDDKGIVHGIRGKKDLDEAPGAYKDIDIVMREQKDLVKILVKLEPLAVIKG